jgi:hypothetical protein
MMASVKSVTFPPREESRVQLDKLQLFFLALEQHKHISDLLKGLQNGRCETEITLPLLARATARLAATTREIAEGEPQ